MPHTFDALWIGCGDGRLRTGRNLEMEKMGVKLVDIPAPPGGALGLVSREIDPNQETLRQAEIYAGLHNPPTIILEAHLDCGAVKKMWGKTFDSEADEQLFLAEKLADAKIVLQKKFHNTKMTGFISKPSEHTAAAFEQVF